MVGNERVCMCVFVSVSVWGNQTGRVREETYKRRVCLCLCERSKQAESGIETEGGRRGDREIG